VTDPDPTYPSVEAFASFDRARLMAADDITRASQLAARQLLYDYTDSLWHDIERAGERPAVGEKYHAVAVVRELTSALRTTAFEAVFNPPTE
jgi:hypothetical protein